MLQQSKQGKAALSELLERVRACRVCRDTPEGAPLPHEPRPVLRASVTARLCVAGQAPGTRVHATGLPFNDPSGDRLRRWMAVDRETFYDTSRIAIVPMGFCYPGQDASGSDLPPRRECAALWHDAIFAHLPQLEVILAIGTYSQAYHLGDRAHSSVTETVRDWRAIGEAGIDAGGPLVIPLPHPSWRNIGWLKKNPWFERDLLSDLRAAVAAVIG
jgi:uracil-DNA glycosylase